MSTMPTQTSKSLNVSLINFGGKNDSPFEFYNSSDDASASYFEKTNEIYNSFKTDNRTLGCIFSIYLSQIDRRNMFNACNNWFIQNMNIEFLSNLSGVEYTDTASLSTFDLANCSLSNVFKYILTKDKGIGGFEQINSSRPSNTIKHYKTMCWSSRFLDKTIFVDNVIKTYNQTNGSFVSPIDGKDNARYSDYFMKGRKEGPSKTKKNYYKDDIIYTRTNNQNFKCVGSLILCLYDIITFEMASLDSIPLSFDNKTLITEKKTLIIENYVKKNNIDILFITEYLYNNSFKNLGDYNIVHSEALDGLSNTIIYKKTLGDFTTSSYPSINASEFKEPPLILENDNMVLVCFHAGGKGILENVSKFTDTELYNYIENIDTNKKVILGGDFNCNIYNDCEIFDVSDNSNIVITSFKQRTSVQPQFDKTNKKDKSKKDEFVIRGYKVTDCFVSMLDSGEDKIVTSECDDSYLLPNNNHPFDHFIVNYTIMDDEESDGDESGGDESDGGESDGGESGGDESDAESGGDDYDGYYYLNYIYEFVSRFFKSDN